MGSRILLVEPKQLTISRIADDFGGSKNGNISKIAEDGDQAELIRSAGDGMEVENATETSSKASKPPWQPLLVKAKPLATSTPSNRNRRDRKNESSNVPKDVTGKIRKSSSKNQLVEKSTSAIPDPEASKRELEELQLKVEALEQSKERLIEEKIKVSKQLGVQTQVNTELKTLLVASVGEDLEERLEKMTLKHALTERQVKRLQNQLEELQEELETTTIQSDVWRSKFLASKVMSDELVSWKALTDSRYRESNAALETLLEEHRQLTTTIASANRFLLKLSKLTNCYHGDETPSGYSSIDLAIMNHSLAKTLTERMINNSLELRSDRQPLNLPSHCIDMADDMQATLSLGEKKAAKAIDDASRQDPHADRRKRDFLAHSRISQILATTYPMTCLTCKGCKGPLKNL